VFWTELEIAPTQDSRLIRRAYAARLKSFDPDADPERFQRLRRAYEVALRQAERSAEPAIPPAPPPREDAATPAPPPAPVAGSPVVPDPVPEPPDPMPDRILAGIADLFNRGETLAAIEGLERALQSGSLPLGFGEGAAEAVLIRTVGDRRIPVGALLRLAQRIGWDQAIGVGSRSARETRNRLFARIDAEAWHRRLTDIADRPLLRSWRRRRLRHAARLLLGRSPRWTAHLVDRARPLRDLLTAYDLHAPWLEERFDPKRVAWCRRVVGAWFRLTPGHILLLLVGVAAAIQNPRVVLVWGLVFGAITAWQYIRSRRS
jgi:hypothetical protein